MTDGSPVAEDRLSDDRLRRGSLAMTAGTFASRGTGLVRTMLLVAAIGLIGPVANAFDVANTLPNQLFALLSAGAIQAVLMPQIIAAIAADDAKERLDKLLTLTTVILAAFTVVLVAATPVLIRLFTLAGGWDRAQIALAIAFGYWCVPQMFFYGLFGVLGDALSARGQFGAIGWAPVANNVVSIAGFGAFVAIWGKAGDNGPSLDAWTTGQTVLLAGTATLGIVVQGLLLVVALRRGGFHWRFRLGVHGLGLRTAGKVVGWTLGAVALEQVGVAYLKNVTSAAGAVMTATGLAAGNAALTNALTIYLLPHSLVVVSIVTALFPRMSAAATMGNLDRVRADMSTALRLAGVFSVLSVAVLVVLAAPLLKALLPSITPHDLDVSAPVLQAMAPGLVAMGATVIAKRMYYAFGDGRGIFVIQVLATASLLLVMWLGTLWLAAPWWTVAAAAATTVSTWISVLARVRGMRRKLSGIDGRRVLVLHLKAGLAAAIAAGVGWALLAAMTSGVSAASLRWGHAVLVCAAVGATMVAVYVVVMKVFRVQELDSALAPLLRRLRGAR